MPSASGISQVQIMNGCKPYCSNFGCDIPSRFRVTKKQRHGRANTRLFYGEAAWQLRKMLGPDACFYSLKWHNLFLDKKYADKRLIYDPKTLKVWKQAIRKHLKPPYFYCIEVGTEGQIHVHVIAHVRAGLLGIKRGGKVAQPFPDKDKDWFCTVSYMYKTPVPLTVDFDAIKAEKLPDWEERLETYHRALKRNNGLVPLLSGYVFR